MGARMGLGQVLTPKSRSGEGAWQGATEGKRETRTGRAGGAWYGPFTTSPNTELVLPLYPVPHVGAAPVPIVTLPATLTLLPSVTLPFAPTPAPAAITLDETESQPPAAVLLFPPAYCPR